MHLWEMEWITPSIVCEWLQRDSHKRAETQVGWITDLQRQGNVQCFVLIGKADSF